MIANYQTTRIQAVTLSGNRAHAATLFTMTNNIARIRLRRLVRRRNRQFDRVRHIQDNLLVEAKRELSNRDVAVLAHARVCGARMRYPVGQHWEIV